jgi:hypothetical protein
MIVTYSVTNPAAEDYALLAAHNGSAAVIGNATGPGNTVGPHMVSISFNATQPDNTQVYARIQVGTVSNQGSAQSCSGGDSLSGPSGPSAPPWPGDDRVAPVPDEYYVIYCSGNSVHVWRGIPQPGQEIAIFSLRTIIDLSNGTLSSNGVTMARNGDSLTFSGTNGNSAPQPGSKSISLNACIQRNGKEPPTGPSRNPRPGGNTSGIPSLGSCRDRSVLNLELFKCLSNAAFGFMEACWLSLTQLYCFGAGTIVLVPFFSQRMRRPRKGKTTIEWRGERWQGKKRQRGIWR